jgi:hypothetical protein
VTDQHETPDETPDAQLAREKHAAAVDPYETPDQKLARAERGHVVRKSRMRSTRGENR